MSPTFCISTTYLSFIDHLAKEGSVDKKEKATCAPKILLNERVNKQKNDLARAF